MARANLSTHLESPKVSRPGVHAKTRNSNNKKSKNYVLFGSCFYSARKDDKPYNWEMFSFKDKGLDEKYTERDLRHMIKLYTPIEYIKKFRLFSKKEMLTNNKRKLH